jgi:hypothetical protein
MVGLFTAKYIREAPTRPSDHFEITSPIPTLSSEENYGDLGFQIYWEAITVPFTMNPESHKHDFPQYLCFMGGDITRMTELGGEIEIALGLDKNHLEKHTITRASTVYLPPGLYHCPLVFKKITRPVMFMEINCAGLYKKLGKG